MKSLTLKAPADMRIPEGTEPGDTFDSMATFRLGEKGMLTLCAIDGKECNGKKGMDFEDRYEHELKGQS